MNTKLLNRAIENAGPMGDAQRRAMWAKRRSPATAAPRAPAPAASLAVRGKPVTVEPRPIPIKPIDRLRPVAPSAGDRPWGESRPGEMYPAVEGPGNPSWERRHPELAPGGPPAGRPRGNAPPILPQDPRGAPGVRYPGGSANFDERTGRYTTPPPRIPIDDGGIALPRTQGRELDPKVRKAVTGLQNMLDRLRGFST